MPDAGSRKEPGAGRRREPEGAKGARKNPKTGPGRNRRSPRSPEGAERKRGARRTTGSSSVLSPCFAGCPPVIGRSLADRWPVVGRSLAGCSADYICRLLPVLTGFQAVPPVVGWSLTRSLAGRLSVACRDFPGCQLLRRLFAGSSPVLSVGAAVPRAVLRPLADFVCRACSVGSVGSIGPLVRRVHWRRRGSVDARTLPRPAPSACIEAAEKRAAARLGAGRRMHAARTSGPDADNGAATRSKPARTDLPRLGHFSSEHLRTERSRAGYFPLGPPCSGHLHSRSSAPAVPSRPLPDTPAQAGNSSGWLLT